MQITRYMRLYWIAALACVVALIYWPSTIFLYDKWSDGTTETYTHGWLILLICIGLVVRARHDLVAAPVRPSSAALVALALAVVAWLVFYRASIEGLEVPLQPVLLWLAATTTFGWPTGRVLLFPLGYFYFAEPVWYGGALQQLTVLVTRGALALTGPAAVVSGDVVHIPNGTFRIEEGCSGLHFMIVGLAVAALYGEQRRDRWPVRIRQLALMAALALLANWVRVYSVIEAGYLTDMKSYLVRVSHYGFGWCVFAVALLIFFWLAPRLGQEPPPRTPPTAAPDDGWLPQAARAGLAAALLVLCALPLLNAGLRLARPAPPLAHPAAALAPRPPWHAVPLERRSAWMPIFVGADELQRQAFANTAADTVEVLGVSYRTQRQGGELVGETSSLLGEGLQSLTERVIGSSAGAFREAEVADASGARSLIWWRYQVDGRNMVNPFIQQMWYGLNALVWRPPAGLLALRSDCRSDCGTARRTLQEFVAGSVRPALARDRQALCRNGETLCSTDSHEYHGKLVLADTTAPTSAAGPAGF
ncbi:MAG: exosortase [Gammaproteobacteria bacterium]|nr:exosortase [Gammaproteobacteria bacterium]